MANSLKVGPQTGSDGQSTPFRGDKSGALVTHSVHGKYSESVLRGRCFVASNVASQAISVGLTTTYTGLCVSNPAGSGKNMVMLGCQYGIYVAEAAIATWHLIGGYSAAGIVTHTAALGAPGILNAFIGAGSSSVAYADTQATTVNPYYLAVLRSGFTAGALGGPGGGAWVDLDGMFVLPPGGWIGFGAPAAITGWGTFFWEEVDA